MSEYLIRKATEKDLPFLAEVVIAAEKGMSDKLSFSTLFNLPEEKVKKLIIAMFEEGIDGCELSLSSFYVVEFNGKAVAGLGSWIECFNRALPSKILKSNLISFTFGRESIEFLKTKSHLVKDIVADREPNALQFEYLYVSKEHLGKELDKKLIERHEKNALVKYPGVEKSQTQLFKNNVFVIKSLLKQGFKIVQSYKSTYEEANNYLPFGEKYLMEKSFKNSTMDKLEIVNKLTPLFRNIFADDSLEVTDSLSAADVKNWDSLSHMLLITEVENKFAIKFKLKELNKMRNVGDMVDIIISKL